MLVAQFRGTFSQSNHSSFHTDSLELRRIEFIRAPRQFFVVDVW